MHWSGIATATVLGMSSTLLLRPLDGVSMMSRADWGAMPQKPGAWAHVPTRITIHHTGEKVRRDRTLVQKLSALQKFSQNPGKLGNGKDKPAWPDVPYHYYIDHEGTIAAARDPRWAGDSNTPYDPRGHLLIVLEGNFMVEPLPEAQWRSLVALTRGFASRLGVPASRVSGHKDWAQTDCPGTALYERLNELRTTLNR